MTYLVDTLYMTNAEFVIYIMNLDLKKLTWKPIGVTWHNTGIPSLAQWEHYSNQIRKAWGNNLDHYYKTDPYLRWHAGPHACGTPDYGIALGDFLADGVHASCYNHDHYGIETVGDFRTGGDDPRSPRGLLSMQSSANIIAALCLKFGWIPERVINFHRQCKTDHHACPGDRISDDWAISLVTDRLSTLQGAAPRPPSTPPAPVSPVPGLLANIDGVAGVMDALHYLGYAGDLFSTAVHKFQADQGLVPGAYGPITQSKLEAALVAKG